MAWWSQFQNGWLGVWTFIEDHWDTLSLLGILLAWLGRVAWSRWQWWRRRFLRRINFSITYVEDGWLRIRTLMERDIEGILLNNAHGQRLLLRAADQATLDQPILKMENQDSWIVLNAALNELSEAHAAGILSKAAGKSVDTKWFVLAFTCEKDPQVEINKIRVMVLAQDLLESDLAVLENAQLERKNHQARINTVRSLKQEWERQSHLLMRIELPV